jgi:hypothetical protein
VTPSQSSRDAIAIMPRQRTVPRQHTMASSQSYATPPQSSQTGLSAAHFYSIFFADLIYQNVT